MFYEFLKEHNLNPLVMTLITDGVSNHSRTAAVVTSSLFDDAPIEKPSYVIPGAHPEQSSEYSDFTQAEYVKMLPDDPVKTVEAIQTAMDDFPFVLVYNHSFFLKFLRKIPEDLDLSQGLNPSIVVDICDVASSSQHMGQFTFDPQLDRPDICRALESWLKGRRAVQAGVPFGRVAASVDDSMWDENMPKWLRSHCKLRKAAEMF